MPFIAPIVGAVFGGLSAIGSFVGSLGLFGSMVVGAGLSIGLGYLQQALADKPQDNGTVDNVPGGVTFERQYGENVSRKVACGRIGIAGHDVYVNTYSSSNNILQQVYVLSDYYTTALSRVAINGEWAVLGAVADPTKGFPVTSGAFANLIWIKFYNGKQTAADAGLVAGANPGSRWSVNHIGKGMSFVVVTMQYDKENNNSFPDFFFEFRGAPLYDWRKDTSVGGSGTHRWGDVSTYEYSDNPIVMEYNYRRGFSIDDDLFCGMGMSFVDLPLDKFTTAANICDEFVGSEKRYICSIQFDCMLTHSDNLKSVALSCGALQIDGIDGSWPIVGTDQPVAMEFTDADIIVGPERKFRKYRSMGDLINLVSGNYPSPEQFWSMIGYKEQTSDTLVTIDRRTRDVSIDFPMVPSARQAAQLASIYLYENRLEATANLTLRPRYQVLEAGDWVRWNSQLYGTFVFVISGHSLLSLDSDGPRNAVLELQQRDGSIYDSVTPPLVIVPTPPGEPVYASEVPTPALVPISVLGDDGRAQAAMRLSWGVITDVTVTGVEIRYFPEATPDAAITKTVRSDVVVHVLSEGVVGNTLYRVQTRLITDPERVTAFSDGLTVTTDNIQIGVNEIDANIWATIGQLEGSIRDQLEEINTRINKMTMNTAARTWLDRKVVRNDLVASSTAAFAQIAEVRQVAIDTEGSLAQLSTEVTAQFEDQSATITQVSTAVADLSGYATANYTLGLNVNGSVVSMQLYNGGPGLNGVKFTVDSFLIQNLDGTGKPIFQAGLIDGQNNVGINGAVVIDGTITAKSFVANSVSAMFATLGEITAGVARSADNQFIMSLDGKFLEIWDDS